MPGPPPKCDSQRRRRNKPTVQTQKAEIQGRVAVPRASKDWHPIAKAWFKSLAESGQAQFFEPSDWQSARFVAEAMTKNLKGGKFSAMLFTAVWSAMGELLSTEGARRRIRLEIEREVGDPDEEAADAVVDELQQRRSG